MTGHSTAFLLAAPSSGKSTDVRGRLLRLALRFPGLGASALAKQAKVSLQLAEYHLHALVRSGLLEEREDGFTVYFAVQGQGGVVDRRDRPLVTALRRPKALQIVLQLLETPTMTMGELAESCSVSPPTATHHVKRLAKAEAVEVIEDGKSRLVQVADPERLRRVLVDNPPPRDTVAGFIDLWERLDV